ncbi:hypothetical protein NMY22_g20197 [Coprinellus aureogranulatus]|nr:hypothetical protein NMY22_g20197 [Coprinellus aureogranulatus]
MDPIFSRTTSSTLRSTSDDTNGDNDIDAFTTKVAQRYLKYPLCHPSIPNAYPVFRKLERLNLGTSVLPISVADLELDMESSDSRGAEGGATNTGQAGSDAASEQEVEEISKLTEEDELLRTLRTAARNRTRSVHEDGPESDSGVDKNVRLNASPLVPFQTQKRGRR